MNDQKFGEKSYFEMISTFRFLWAFHWGVNGILTRILLFYGIIMLYGIVMNLTVFHCHGVMGLYKTRRKMGCSDASPMDFVDFGYVK